MRSRAVVPVILSAMLAACGGDSTGVTPPASGSASHEQIVSLSSAMTGLLEYAYEGHNVPNSLRPAVSASLTHGSRNAFVVGFACGEGGQIAVAGSYTATLTEQFIAVTDTLSDCGVRDGLGNVWRFDTDQALESNIHLQVLDPTDFADSQTVEGNFRYSNGEVSGRCAIDVTIAHRYTITSKNTGSSTNRVRTDGTICGRLVHTDTLIVRP